MSVESSHASVMTRASLGLPASYVAPEGELETTVAKIYGRIFNIDQVGAEDDFFDIGGDSLVAESISLEILQQTGHEFPMSEFLEYSTPRQIAAALENKAGTGAAKSPAVADAEARPPIFVVHGRRGYTMPAPSFLQALAKGQKLRMFELPGIRGGESLERIEDIADAYIDQIYQEYPRGPVLLASFCAGGLIALEMAARLATKGRPVKHLVLIDPPIRKNGTLGFVSSPLHLDLLHRAKKLPQRLLPRFLRLRYHDRKWNRGVHRQKNSALGLSTTAQAKLYAALNDFCPPRHGGPVTILASSRRAPRLQDGSHAAQTLPNRTLHLVFEQHLDVTSDPRAAEMLQAACDAALADG